MVAYGQSKPIVSTPFHSFLLSQTTNTTQQPEQHSTVKSQSIS